MKNINRLIVGASVIMSLMCIGLSGCNGQQVKEESNEHNEGHQHAAVYQCPMKCEGEKTYAEAGKCPKCEMDLTAVHQH